MGVFGSNTVDDDAFYYYLDELCEKLLNDVQMCFNQISNQDAKFNLDIGNEILMPALDILITLCKQYEISHDIDKSQVQQWKEIYLAFYDVHIHELGAKERYVIGRRIAIEETFSQLYNFASDNYPRQTSDEISTNQSK